MDTMVVAEVTDLAQDARTTFGHDMGTVINRLLGHIQHGDD
jgi:hypothetical protein